MYYYYPYYSSIPYAQTASSSGLFSKDDNDRFVFGKNIFVRVFLSENACFDLAGGNGSAVRRGRNRLSRH